MRDPALLTDLYELHMMASDHAQGMEGTAACAGEPVHMRQTLRTGLAAPPPVSLSPGGQRLTAVADHQPG